MGSPSAKILPKILGARCDECPLKNEVPVFATPPIKVGSRPSLVVVGEGPGRKEVAQGRPFVGPSGALLNETLGKAGIKRSESYVTNAMLCRGDDRDNEKALVCCAPRLLAEVAALPPDVPILALGAGAAASILGVHSIVLARGFIWRAPDLVKKVEDARKLSAREDKKDPNSHAARERRRRLEIIALRNELAGRVVFPTVHPAFVMRADAWRSVLEIDVGRVGRYIRGEVVDEADLKKAESVEEFISACGGPDGGGLVGG